MSRKRDKAKTVARLEADLAQMFSVLARRPVPDAITSVADQLDEGPTAELPRRRRKA
jgi:hypothetical protein